MFLVLLHIQANPSPRLSLAMHTAMTHISCLISALWLHRITCKGSNAQYALLHSVTETTHKKYRYAIQKHPWCKKQGQVGSTRPPVTCTSIFYMQLKDVISGTGQGLLRFNHFVDAAIYNHVQANSNNLCSQTIETSTTKRTNCNV